MTARMNGKLAFQRQEVLNANVLSMLFTKMILAQARSLSPYNSLRIGLAEETCQYTHVGIYVPQQTPDFDTCLASLADLGGLNASPP